MRGSTPGSCRGGRVKLLFFVLAVALLCLGLAAPAFATTTISGHITGTQHPAGVPHGWVDLYTADALGTWWMTSTGTDASGNYTIPASDVPTGAVYLERASDSDNQYLPQLYGGREDITWEVALGTPIVAGPQTPATRIDFNLHLPSHITGSVAWPDGMTHSGWATFYVYNPAGYWQGAISTELGDSSYDVALAAGTYRIMVQPNDGPAQVYDSLFTNDPGNPSASAVSVGVQSTTSGIDFFIAPWAGTHGRVADSGTGTAVADARVVAYREGMSGNWDWANEAYTDASGLYSITNLSPGIYRFVASESGHRTQFYDGHNTDDVNDPSIDSVAIFPGDNPNLDFSLDGYPHIRGTVTGSHDPEGFPAFVWAVQGSESGWNWANSTYTSGGSYDLPVAPGTYRVFAAPNDDRYAQQLYPGVDVDQYDFADPNAQDVSVTFGHDLTDIDFVLHGKSTISGSINWTGNEYPNGYVNAYRQYSWGWSWVAQAWVSDFTPTYLMANLIPGTYRVGLATYFDGTTYYGGVLADSPNDPRIPDIQVAGDSAVENIDITPHDSSSHIEGTVTRASDGQPLAYSDVWFLQAADWGGWYWNDWAQADYAGNYRSNRMVPGRYRVFSNNYYSGSFMDQYYDHVNTSNSYDPRITDIYLAAGETRSNIDFALANWGAVISGKVEDAVSHEPVKWADVTFWRDYGWGWGWENGAQTDASGYYTSWPMFAGDYKVQASVGNGEYLSQFYDGVNTDEVYDSRADVVSVADGDARTGVDFRLAKAGKITGHVGTADGAILPYAQITAMKNYDYGWDWAGSTWVGDDASGYVAASGYEYSIGGLNDGTYRVVFETSDNYLNEAYKDHHIQGYETWGPVAEGPAEDITVKTGEVASGIDATFERAAVIRGRLTGTDGPLHGHAYATVYRFGIDGAWRSVGTVSGYGFAVDGSGYYSAGKLGAGDYRVAFRSDDYLDHAYSGVDSANVNDPRCATIHLEDSEIRDGVNDVLEPAGRITGQIRAYGDWLDGDATAYLKTGRGWNWASSNWFSASGYGVVSGYYQIKGLIPGTYRVAFSPWNGNYAPQVYNGVTVAEFTPDVGDDISVGKGETVDGINATFHKAASISGRIGGSDGRRSPWLDVAAYKKVGDDWTRWTRGWSYDSSGYYSLPGLLPGTYRLVFDASGYSPQAYNGIDTTDPSDPRLTDITITADEDITGIDVMLTSSRSIAGRVIAPDGTPLGGVNVQSFPVGSRDWVGVHTAITDASGYYQIDGAAELSQVLFGSELSGYLDTYAPQYYGGVYTQALSPLVPASPDVPTTGIDAILQVGGSISGRVVDMNGDPLRDSPFVNVTRIGEGGTVDRFYDSADTDASGYYTIRGLAPGNYIVGFHGYFDGIGEASACYKQVPDENMAEPVAVVLGEETSGIDATLAPRGSVGGRLQLPDSVDANSVAVRMWLDTTEGWQEIDSGYTSDWFVRANGAFEARRLMPGQYKIAFDGGRSYPTRFYPDATTLDGAEAISVEPGRETWLEVGPRASAPMTLASYEAGWQKGPVDVSLVTTGGTDPVSTFYSIDGSDPTLPYLGTFQVTDEGVTTLKFYSVDAAGNREDVKSAEVLVDRTGPESQAHGVPEGWSKDDVNVDLTATDNLSGVDNIYYAAGTDASTTVFTDPLTFGEGVTTLEYFADDIAGNAETPHKTVEIKVDKTGPSVSSDAMSSYRNDARIEVTGSDDLSGVDSYHYRVNGGATVDASVFTTSTAGDYSIEYWSTDEAGNDSGHETKSFVVVKRVEQDDSHIAYRGSWTPYAKSAYSGGTYTYTKTAGAGAYVSFTGTEVRWIGTKGANMGIAKVSLDGGAPVDVDLYGPYQAQATIWSASGLTDGPHTVSIEYTGTKRAAATDTIVNVDAFEVDGTLDQGVLPLLRYEQDDAKLAYAGSWTSYAKSAYSGGTYTYTKTAGAAAYVSFTGTEVRWIGTKGANMGIAKVRLDGGAAVDVDLYGPYQAQATIWSASGLTNGPHTVSIEYAGTKRTAATDTIVNADAFEVRGLLGQAAAPLGALVEQNAPGTSYSAGWTTYAKATYSGGSYAYTKTAGAYTTYTFTGSAIQLIAAKAKNMGIARVSVDGGTPTDVDLYSSTFAAQAVVFTNSGLGAGSHTLRVEFTGTKRSAATDAIVNVDAFRVTP